MSKRCPSKKAHKKLSGVGREVSPARAWRSRVFKNTFTRNGRRMRLKKWSVKIQHQRRRQTFSLLAATRDEAAIEALEIHDLILRHGWEAAAHYRQFRKLPQSRHLAAASLDEQPDARAGVEYWKQRLIERKYTEARLTPGKEWSVRIEHLGNYNYFPLGTHDRDEAALRAQKVYLTAMEKGWNAACEQFSREFTLGIFWSHSPIAVTYTTLYTLLDGAPREAAPVASIMGKRRRGTLALVEPDAALHKPLAFWLNRQPGFVCQEVWSSVEKALDRLERRQVDLVLVNRAQPTLTPVEAVEKIKARWPELPVFGYGIFEDSDQIFITIGGVTAGYLLRRRTPTELFEPIRGAFGQRAASANEINFQVRGYFQSFFDGAQAGQETAAAANLTDREQKVLNFLSKGYLDKEIADALRISVWTVHNHLKKTFEKLNVRTRTEAALKYLQK